MVVLMMLAQQAHAVEHTVGIEYRHAWIPAGILDLFFFDSNDEGALPFDRPAVASNSFGLNYRIAKDPGGGPGLELYLERQGYAMQAGYWDDRDNPVDHIDGDWLSPTKLGSWNLGASYVHEHPLFNADRDVWVGLAVGGGLGVAIRSGRIALWHHGRHEDTIDPGCGSDDPATGRYLVCVSDGDLGLPGALPILDLLIGPRVHITEHAMVGVEFGLHNLVYLGLSGGGSF